EAEPPAFGTEPEALLAAEVRPLGARGGRREAFADLFFVDPGRRFAAGPVEAGAEYAPDQAGGHEHDPVLVPPGQDDRLLAHITEQSEDVGEGSFHQGSSSRRA